MDRRTQEQYIKQIFALSDAHSREDIEQNYRVMFSENQADADTESALSMQESLRFLHAVAMFCFGNLDALDDVFYSLPSRRGPTVLNEWGKIDYGLRRVYSERRNLAYALRDLTPLPDVLFDIDRPRQMRSWFKRHREHLVWDDERGVYIFTEAQTSNGRFSQEHYLDYLVPRSLAVNREHLVELFLNLDDLIDGNLNDSNSDDPRVVAHRIRYSTHYFIIAIGAFCLGYIGAVKYAIALLPPKKYPVDILREAWGEEDLALFLRSYGTIRSTITALRDLTPMPDDIFDTNNPARWLAWFDQNKIRLKWNSDYREYTLRKM
ncbi:MAG: hypothetical protein L0154_10505 [Chloroflexi bacterium]|nr:hypothetical protein [Chloroflexota bacterium]